jgi:hypothetical protein
MGLSVTTVNKPLPGIATGNVPEELAEFLAIEVPKVLGNNDGKDKELFLSHDTEALAKQYAGYARAWGMREDGAAGQTELHQTDKDGNDVLVDGKPVIIRQAIGYQVEIKRIVNRRDMPDTQVRMTVRKYDPDAPRAGRPAGTGSANGETPAPTPPAQSDSKK